jgi:regulator of protease activity HflC (stomatin/prohibitin superfamily)
MSNEKTITPLSGYLMLLVFALLFFGGIATSIMFRTPLFFIVILAAIIMLPGFVKVNPNGSRVLLLFGKYMGTIRSNGLFWINPLYSKNKNFITSKKL